MNDESYRIFPLGDAALTVDFGNAISVALNDRAIALAEHLTTHPFPGFIECVPAYSSVSIFYDVAIASKGLPKEATVFGSVSNLVKKALISAGNTSTTSSRHLEIPMRFDRESAMDLEFVAAEKNMSASDVIDIFTASEYRVFMLGFLPGFSYMGELDERLSIQRKDIPRTRVPAGSIAIAGRQAGIYSLASPGGWQIIGRTDLDLFDPEKDEPCRLRAGDLVRFIAVK